MLDFHRFVRDFHLQPASSGKHYRRGWINVPCPFCVGTDGHHLGFNEQRGYFKCYRCGWHTSPQVLQAIARVNSDGLDKLLDKYDDGRPTLPPRDEEKTASSPLCAFPMGTTAMAARHRKYLEGRGFDPDYLERAFDLKGTGPLGDYKFRIIAPIYLNGTLVSYQGRDITGKSDFKYKACAEKDEVVHHKHTLYGIDMALSSSVVIVEGIADVWRGGLGFVATFGTQWKKEQLPHLKNYKNRFVIYDPGEPAAQMQARKLAAALSVFGGHNEVIELDGNKDPGALSEADIKHLRSELSL